MSISGVKYVYIKWEYWSTAYKIKHYMRHKNKFTYKPTIIFKLDFQKVDQHIGGKWLIHGTKCHKDNQVQSLELPS